MEKQIAPKDSLVDEKLFLSFGVRFESGEDDDDICIYADSIISNS